MLAVKSDLQKLENLLKSATNARQRKMYQSLLDKALKDTKQHEVVSVQKAQTEAPSKTKSPAKQKQKKRSTKKVKEEDKVSELKTAKKAKQEIETSEIKATKKGDSQKSPAEQPANSIPQENQTNAEKPSQKIGQDLFQAVGWIKCTPQIKDYKLYITINGKQYDLRRGKFGARKQFDNLKLELEQNASKELWLRVYPRIAHIPGKEKIDFWFSLTKVISDDSLTENQQEYFILRGIWHQVAHCSEPVITVYRNINMLQYYKRTSSHSAKKAFARPQDFPVIWNSPVKPYRYNSKLEKNEQMPRYFVQVRAVFKDGKFEVTEAIEEPTLDIPKYIKPPKNNFKRQSKKIS